MSGVSVLVDKNLCSYFAVLCQNIGTFVCCRFGYLSYEMYRACRLVADTGLHAMQYVQNCKLQISQFLICHFHC